jgi:hypothetical protein
VKDSESNFGVGEADTPAVRGITVGFHEGQICEIREHDVT